MADSAPTHARLTAGGERSCYLCNRKKIRCSKTAPCTHCVRLGLDCVFPGPGRAPRRKKRPLKAELVSRLKSLEQELTERTGGSDPAGARRAADEQGTLVVGGDSTHYLNHEALLGLSGQVRSRTACRRLGGYWHTDLSMAGVLDQRTSGHCGLLWRIHRSTRR